MRAFHVIIILILLHCSLFAQDAHYWTEQYGTRSMLLSNSVVGVVEDLGAVFYNPARLGLIKNPAFVISGKVYELNKLLIENATGDDPNATKKNSSFGGAPSLVAGTFSIKRWEKHRFAYAFLSRRRMDLNLAGGANNYGELIEELPGEEYFSGSISLSKKFNEEWIGGSWAYSSNPKYSIGVTGFINIRNQDASGTTFLQAYNDQDVVMYRSQKLYGYKNYGLLFKIGLAANFDPVKVGLTITTPTIGIKGEGTFQYEEYFSGFDNDDPIYVRNIQGGIDSKFKTPFSIATGVGVYLWGGTLMGSAEYFSKINNYTLMQGVMFEGQSNGKELLPLLYDESKAVLNFGLGYKFVISEQVKGYLSYSSDKSAVVSQKNNIHDETMQIRASTFVADVNHYAGGMVMDFARADITFGVAFASARYPISQPIDFPNGNGGSIVDPNNHSDVSWNRWRFILGISIPFINDTAKKWEKRILEGRSDED